MKVVDFIKGNEVKFGINCLAYFKQHDTMEEAWDKCEDPMRLIAILQCLLNPNYDLSIIGFLVQVTKFALPASDHLDYKRLIARAIQYLEEYSTGKTNLEGFAKAHQDYELKMRMAFQENNPPGLTIWDKQLIYGCHLAMLWLRTGQELGTVYAAHHFVKSLPPVTHAAVANLLKNCVGNPFLT